MTFTKELPERKLIEIINNGDEVIVLSSNDDGIVYKEIHTHSVSHDTNSILIIGACIESIIILQASGSWKDRYTLEYA